jgi:hypothetical protein
VVGLSVSLPAVPDDEPCLGVALARRATVELSSPLAGRRITGPDRGFAEPGNGSAAFKTVRRGDTRLWVVPRVLGLAPVDAEWVLHAQGFRTTLVDPRGREIVDQDPAAESVPTDQNGTNHGVVRLTAGSS